jgi:hypothetical protein
MVNLGRDLDFNFNLYFDFVAPELPLAVLVVLATLLLRPRGVSGVRDLGVCDLGVCDLGLVGGDDKGDINGDINGESESSNSDSKLLGVLELDTGEIHLGELKGEFTGEFNSDPIGELN